MSRIGRPRQVLLPERAGALDSSSDEIALAGRSFFLVQDPTISAEELEKKVQLLLEHVCPGKEARESVAQVLKRVRRSGAQDFWGTTSEGYSDGGALVRVKKLFIFHNVYDALPADVKAALEEIQSFDDAESATTLATGALDQKAKTDVGIQGDKAPVTSDDKSVDAGGPAAVRHLLHAFGMAYSKAAADEERQALVGSIHASIFEAMQQDAADAGYRLLLLEQGDGKASGGKGSEATYQGGVKAWSISTEKAAADAESEESGKRTRDPAEPDKATNSRKKPAVEEESADHTGLAPASLVESEGAAPSQPAPEQEEEKVDVDHHQQQQQPQHHQLQHHNQQPPQHHDQQQVPADPALGRLSAIQTVAGNGMLVTDLLGPFMGDHVLSLRGLGRQIFCFFNQPRIANHIATQLLQLDHEVLSVAWTMADTSTGRVVILSSRMSRALLTDDRTELVADPQGNAVTRLLEWLGGHKLQVQLVAEDGTHLVTKPCDMAGDFLAAAFADDDSMHELVLDKSASRGLEQLSPAGLEGARMLVTVMDSRGRTAVLFAWPVTVVSVDGTSATLSVTRAWAESWSEVDPFFVTAMVRVEFPEQDIEGGSDDAAAGGGVEQPPLSVPTISLALQVAQRRRQGPRLRQAFAEDGLRLMTLQRVLAPLVWYSPLPRAFERPEQVSAELSVDDEDVLAGYLAAQLGN